MTTPYDNPKGLVEHLLWPSAAVVYMEGYDDALKVNEMATRAMQLGVADADELEKMLSGYVRYQTELIRLKMTVDSLAKRYGVSDE